MDARAALPQNCSPIKLNFQPPGVNGTSVPESATNVLWVSAFIDNEWNDGPTLNVNSLLSRRDIRFNLKLAPPGVWARGRKGDASRCIMEDEM
jgi:hypothetical protein